MYEILRLPVLQFILLTVSKATNSYVSETRIGKSLLDPFHSTSVPSTAP